jgi:general secretion pathway protein E
MDDEPIFDETNINELARALLVRAIGEGATDLHVEPTQAAGRIRWRVDGVLQTARQVPKVVFDLLIAEYKGLSGIPTTGPRIPRQGRIDISVQASSYRLRVSACPTFFGEKVVIRITDPSTGPLDITGLGMWDDDRERLTTITNRGAGVLFFVSTTGTGKTTTIYGLLSQLAVNGKKAATIEDYIEADLRGVLQTEINRKAGLTFAAALRAMQRADADAVYVSGAYDREILQLIIEVAAAGQFLMTVVSAPSAAAVVRRLFDMGVDKSDVASVLRGSVAQRLVRRLCSACAEPVTQEEVDAYGPIQALAAAGGYDMPHDAVLYHGRGCESCRGRGYKGRIGLFEVMEVTPLIAEAIARGADTSEINTLAIANGMKTLWADGMRKAVAGITTVDEVDRTVFRPER